MVTCRCLLVQIDFAFGERRNSFRDLLCVAIKIVVKVLACIENVTSVFKKVLIVLNRNTVAFCVWDVAKGPVPPFVTLTAVASAGFALPILTKALGVQILVTDRSTSFLPLLFG